MKMICIVCPRGCALEVSTEGGTVAVSGQGCARGEAYARSEVENPTRMVTALVHVAGMRRPLPVKTRTGVPKASIDAVLFACHQTTVQLPVKIGDVVVPDVAGTGVDLVATANMGGE